MIFKELDPTLLCRFERDFLKAIDFQLYSLSNPSTFIDYFLSKWKGDVCVFDTAREIASDFWEGENTLHL